MTRGSATVNLNTVVVLDNGAGFCKAGLSGQPDPAVVVPNCLARPRYAKKWIVADQIDQCTDIQGISLKRPMDRGYLISPETEKEIWDRIFKTLLKVRPAESGLVLVEPLFNLPSIQKTTDEIVFEDFGFQSLYVANAPALTHFYEASRAPESLFAQSNCSLVVDSGFSFTHAAPVFDGFLISHAAKRINLGGKALTNYLKELVSYRTWNMMDETYIMEDVKEKLCFCSLNVAADLNIARRRGNSNSYYCHYMLPDGLKHKRGYVKDTEASSLSVLNSLNESQPEGKDLMGKNRAHKWEAEDESKDKPKSAGSKQDQEELTLTNERFLVPEMLFRPADLGMNEAGLAECIVRSVSACHQDLQPLLYSSILLTGGNTLFPGFAERLRMELRPLVPDEYAVQIHAVDSPLLSTWRGGSLLAESLDFQASSVSKMEYEEHGPLRCRRRFMA